MTTTRADVKISGRAIEDGFPEEARDFALLLGLSGWVRKKDPGTFEAAFEGDQDALSEMLTFCKGGAKTLEVAEMDVTFLEASGVVGFEIEV